MRNDCPAFSASVAFSTLAMADSRALRFTGMKRAEVKGWPAIGHLKREALRRIAILRGIAPTTAGASAELGWLAAKRHTPGGMRSRPRTRTRTPTARTKNITPRIPAQ